MISSEDEFDPVTVSGASSSFGGDAGNDAGGLIGAGVQTRGNRYNEKGRKRRSTQPQSLVPAATPADVIAAAGIASPVHKLKRVKALTAVGSAGKKCLLCGSGSGQIMPKCGDPSEDVLVRMRTNWLNSAACVWCAIRERLIPHLPLRG